MDTWGIVQYALIALPLTLAALVGHFYLEHRRRGQGKGLAVLRAVNASNEPLGRGRRDVTGIVRARTDKPPIEGFVQYEAGHYRASTGRFVLSMTLLALMLVMVGIGVLKRKDGFFGSKPWFER